MTTTTPRDPQLTTVDVLTRAQDRCVAYASLSGVARALAIDPSFACLSGAEVRRMLASALADMDQRLERIDVTGGGS